MDAYALAIIISVVVYIGIGNYAGRKVKHLDDYFVAGRQAPTFMILGTLVASVVGTNSFLGDVGMTYDGYAAVMIVSTPITVAGYVLGALLFGRFIRRARTATVAEFFGLRFQSRRLRRFAAFTVVIGVGGYLMTVTQGAAMVMTWITDISYVPALIAVWLGYTTFTIYSGSRGVVITDTLMFMLFATIGITALALIADAAGGWFESVRLLTNFEARPGIISAAGFSGDSRIWATPTDMWIWASIMGVSWAFVVAISPWQSSRYLMARDEHVVIRSACIAVCVLTVLWTLIYISGPVIAVLNPNVEPSNNAMIWAAMNAIPVFFGALLLAGIVSAGLSSASTFLTLVGFAISNDVLDESTTDDATRLRVSRITILIVGIVTLILAIIVPPNVYWITNMVGPMFAAVWGPVAFMSIWSKRITEPAAFWGMVAGFVGYVIPKTLSMLAIIKLPSYLDPLLLGFVISLTTALLLSRNGEVTAEQTAYRKSLHVRPAELNDKKAMRRTLMWPNIMMAWGVVATVILLIVYTRPYQLAAGLIPADGPFVTWSGELVVAVAFGATITLAGAGARFIMLRIDQSGT
ncbi:MAG: sodium:solute symporter family protein [Woeseiaceae bacterium]